MAPRSRTGCLTCRQRKLKCSEERPVCAQCVKAHRECIPSSGITFRHQQNPSMNGTKASRESLKSFYGYKRTFGDSTTWVPIPQDLTFIHTNNPYDDEDGQLENFLGLPTDVATMNDHGPEYVPAANMGMGSLSSSIEARTHQDQSGQSNEVQTSNYGSYSTYATHGLEALSAVASRDQYNYAPPPAPMGQGTEPQISPTQAHFPATSPMSPRSQHSHTGSQGNTGLEFLLHTSAAMQNPDSPSQQHATTNIDPRLHSPFQTSIQDSVNFPPPLDVQPDHNSAPSEPKFSLNNDMPISSPTQHHELEALLQSSAADS